MLAKRTYKNQITIPQAVAKEFPGVEYFDVKRRGQEIVLKPVTFNTASENLERIRNKMSQIGITEKNVEEAVRWARNKS